LRSIGRSVCARAIFKPTPQRLFARDTPTVIGSPISGVASSMFFAAARLASRSRGSCQGWKARSKVLLWTEYSTLPRRSVKARTHSSGVMCTAGQ
jgi:hypothetical protein